MSTTKVGRQRFALLLGVALCGGPGCASYAPPEAASQDYRARMETQVEGDVRVSAVVLGAEESEQAFATTLADDDIQPIWLEIENGEDHALVLMLLSLDPDYYSPSEAAWLSRGFGERRVDDKIRFFYEQHIPIVIAPQKTARGFVYTNFDPGAKAYIVELIGEGERRQFEFVQAVPGFEADFAHFDADAVYDPAVVQDLDPAGLRRWLEDLPCCVFGGDRETPGDPLNLVIVGEGGHVLATLVRRGWDLTETVGVGSAWRTAMSSLFGSRYRTSPVSPLYLFDRPQDAALQKARATVDERNHLRLWLAPVRFQGMPVWVGQISRDIGVKLSSRTVVTHKIDPYVDEARTYISLDLAASDYLAALAYVAGVGRTSPEAPRFNYTHDPYYTDGLRAVLILAREPVALRDLDLLDWETPPVRSGQEAGSGTG